MTTTYIIENRFVSKNMNYFDLLINGTPYKIDHNSKI